MASAKRNAKDTLFSNLFGRSEYLLQLYKGFHPEDTEVTENMLHDITIRNILTDRIYNDLGFTVRDKLMVLVEAQSTWSVNIVIRALMYLVESYKDRFVRCESNLYSSKAVDLPEPELYVIYTGEREEHPDILTLSQEFFDGKQTALDVTVKILYGDDRQSIVGQYVRFCKVLNGQISKYGYTEKAIAETIRICKDENVLRDYLNEHEQEAVNTMMTLFDDEYIQKAYGQECKKEGLEEGIRQGMQQGMQQGIQQGMQKGEERFSQLMKTLFTSGRDEDAKRAVYDVAFREQLMKVLAI